MTAEAIAQVRRFNRVVTQRVGALHDHFLARDRSLGEARLLWEIGATGQAGRDVRALRSQLGLDSGYLSRLLQALQADGLVTIGPKESDRRVRIARLTRAGMAERGVLDRRSDDLAESILAPLSAGQRDRLAAAMAEVERLLTATMVEIAPLDSKHPHARYCLDAYFAELNRRFDAGFDPALSIPAGVAELRPPHGLLLVATLRGEPVGCGGLKFHDREPPEIKRMWIAAEVRGLGVGRRLLAELEAHAVARGADRIRLETNKALVEAINLYRSAGFVEVAPYNDEPYAHHWFEKRLTP
ncbi:MAG: helix-turn-helix domain-containing GNAT family N-acetyltransferase [Sporichthyaceae bacterium]|nr:helix-turn-helix domain-containing GNAT family N-acetyltransferase [Sporichthyaceae bacterium]